MKYVHLAAPLALMTASVLALIYSPTYGNWRHVSVDGVVLSGTIHPRCRQAQRFSMDYGPCPWLLTAMGRASSNDFGEYPESGNGVSVILYRQDQHSSPCQINAAKNGEVLQASDFFGGRTYERIEGGMLSGFSMEVTRSGARPVGGFLSYGAQGELVAWSAWGADYQHSWQWNEELAEFVAVGEHRYRDGPAEWQIPVMQPVRAADEDPAVHNARIRERAEAWRDEQVAYFSEQLGTPIPMDCSDLAG
ncbi:hypothetical protein HNE05_01270 [Aquipseudomonas campi]|uniref:Uncharacterized protein n=1 Tax=Aquipseudomonas campi TaxID=2731681 RepID=A0A6M8FY08_9GAMM|nr:hypothetical protein [Pseudomonas campi]QKE62055.1 hypothetical protein HNE05_01270 [Pseudomonas campi]